jgi:SAM-dependent methyltransferase
MDKPDYGIDAPGVIRILLLIGLFLIIAALLPFAKADGLHSLRITALVTGPILVAEAGLMLLYAKVGKFAHRDRMLKLVSWDGSEKVLDVGTGRGLLMIGAAHHLQTGQAVGIDIWNTSDLSGNRIENTLRNAELERVLDKVQVENVDATAMPFPDRAFAVVLSNLCLHNIPSRQGRAKACAEIARVLKPGGKAIISDFKNTRFYAAAFRTQGLEVERKGPFLWDTFPPLRIVIATRPEA